jgi:hypothetical protein
MNSRQYGIHQPPSFYQNGFIPPPPHLTNYNYSNGFSFPYQGMIGYHSQNYAPFTHPSHMSNGQVLAHQNGYGQFQNHQALPNAINSNHLNQSNNVSFNYNMNFYMNPYGFPIMGHNGVPVFNPFMDAQKYYGGHPNYSHTGFSGNRVVNQSMGSIQDPGKLSRANRPSYIDLDG